MEFRAPLATNPKRPCSGWVRGLGPPGWDFLHALILRACFPLSPKTIFLLDMPPPLSLKKVRGVAQSIEFPHARAGDTLNPKPGTLNPKP